MAAVKLYLICASCGQSWVGWKCWQCSGLHSARHSASVVQRIRRIYDERVADAKLARYPKVEYDADETAKLFNG